MATNIEIIIGTYEEFLLGYKVEIRNEKEALLQSFADKSHTGSIKCIAVRDKWIATGATDDRIFIYDMSTRKQSQILLIHDGTINALVFTPDGTHLLSGGEDGRMIATRLKTWSTEATWQKAHNGAAVTHISCHPSGKLALSLGSDLVLRTWNLVKGRVAYKTNLKSRNTLGPTPGCLEWSPSGDYFTLSGQRIVEFWSIKTADVVHSRTTKSKPICSCWIAESICLIGLEDGKFLWIDLDGNGRKEFEFTAHSTRVKAMCCHKDYLVTASSAGEVKLWQLDKEEESVKEISAVNIGCRPICVGILDLEQFGANYVISSTVEKKDKEIKPTISKTKQPSRGVVTIEYEHEETNENSDKDNDTESTTEKESSGNDEDINENDGGSGSDSEEEKDSKREEKNEDMKLSRKHKISIAGSQKTSLKKQKLNKNTIETPKKPIMSKKSKDKQ